MSYKNLMTKAGIIILPFGLAACGTIGGRTAGLANQEIKNVPEMAQTVAVRDPCNSVGIEAVPETQVTNLEINQNLRAGRRVQHEKGYVIFSDEPLATKFAPLAGAVIGGVAGAAVGGGAGRVIITGLGVVAGAVGGEKLGKDSRVEYLTDLAACRFYLNQIGPAPFRRFITNGPDDRPTGAEAKIFDNKGTYLIEPAPYSDTSPGGRRDPNRRNIPKPRFGD